MISMQTISVYVKKNTFIDVEIKVSRADIILNKHPHDMTIWQFPINWLRYLKSPLHAKK